MHDMSAHAHVAHPAPPTSFIRKYIFSLDHKVIGKQYYGLALVAVLVGMFLSWLMRIHLGWTNLAIPGLHLLSSNGAPGNVMTPEFYLQLMTMHATIMVFFVLTTAPFAGFGNFFLPIQVGAEDMPFPRFNMMSFWVTFVAFVVLVSSFFVGDGPTLGGWTLLWPHLFWFFGHPEVYVAIVPGMGIISHVLITSMRKPLLSHRVVVYSMGALAVLSYMVYGHHMFVSGMNPISSLAFSFPTLIITIPSTILVLIWLGSLYGARLRITSASLFALGFVSMFISGGVSGFFLAQPSVDIMLHATYFVVGHFHMVMGVAAMFGIFAGTYFWFPKMFGRMMNETLGKIHFWCSFVGTYCIFMPFHYLGMAGNVRRYQAFVNDYTQPLIPLHRFITVAALFTGAAQLIFVYNLIHSRFWGKPAPDNPWQATSLEWSTPSTPPPHNNFGDKLPEVYHDPYQYGVESSVGDYVMQASPEQVETAQDEA